MAVVIPDFGTYRYNDPIQTVTHSSGGALAVDVSLGSYVVVTLTSNITALSFTNFPPSGEVGSCTLEFVQGGGGGFTVGFGTITWAGGVAPTVTATAAAVDVITFNTRDGGTTVKGYVAGQDFS